MSPPVRETWQRDPVHFPDPLPPLAHSYNLEPAGVGTATGFEEWSLPLERMRLEPFDGYAYLRMEPFGGEPPALLGALMKRVPALAHLWRLDPASRKRIRGFDAFVAGGGFEANVDRWDEEWEPEARRRLDALWCVPLTGMSDVALADHLDALHDYVVWSWSVHANVHFVSFYLRGRFFEACQRLLGLSRDRAQDLLQGADDRLREDSAALQRLADDIAGDPETAAALVDSDDDPLAVIRSSRFAAAFAEYLEQRGHRALDGYDITRPRLYEHPEIAASLLRDTLRTDGGRPDRGEPENPDASLYSERLAPGDREEFERWLSLARRAYPLNERHEHLLTDLPESLIRYAWQEAGRRLAARGAVAGRDDVLFLYREELTGLLRTGGPEAKERVAARRAELANQRQLDPPELLGPEPEDPPLHALPPHAADALRILLEEVAATEADPAAASADPDNDGLRGIPGSPGVAQGRVRLVSSMTEFADVRPGEVLVCRMTTPAWTVLFPLVAGLVTDSGGALSHAAIVAREYGVTAVVGTGDATRRLRTGDAVQVDGWTGEVAMIDEALLGQSEPRPAPTTSASRQTNPGVQPVLDGPRVVGLDDDRAQHVGLAGGKGARLAQLLAAGFAVPAGFVVTVSAPPPSHRGLDPDLAGMIRRAYAGLGRPQVAVRSSAIAEDLAGASFAGQYDTFLDVAGDEEVLAAVQRCVESSAGERAAAYHGAGAEVRMAVVVQAMAPCDAAGVAFSADPINGDRDTVVIEAAAGLGEQVVGGQVVPDRWAVRGGEIDTLASGSDQPCLSNEAVLELTALVRTIEAHFGGEPQDVEWSYGHGRFHVLQARPITTLNKQAG